MKSLGIALMWLFASATATGIAWSGIGVLDDDLVEQNTIPLTGESIDLASESVGSEQGGSLARAGNALLSDRSTLTLLDSNSDSHDHDNDDRDNSGRSGVDDEPDDGTSTTSTTGGGSTFTSQTTSTSNSTSTSSAASSSSTTTGQTTSTQSTSTTNTTPTTQPTTSTTATTSPTITGQTASTGTQPPSSAQTKTFHLIGGSTAISVSPTETRVLWATPNPGFDVDIEPEYPGVKVEFRSDEHRSRVDVWWSNGPQHEIREREG